jgi:hypothetical protein
MAHVDAEAGAREGVVLDVGLGVGAVVVLTPPGLAGREIELGPAGDPARRRVHAVVHERWTGVTQVFAAVFVDVPEGAVDLWVDGALAAGRLAVGSGEVATIDWRRGEVPAGPGC